jgi:hypothetical protein
MWIKDIQSLLQVKQMIDGLKAIDRSTLTKTERAAVQDCLEQAYDRVAYLLEKYRGNKRRNLSQPMEISNHKSYLPLLRVQRIRF